MNHRRTYRLYRDEGLSIRAKLPKRKRAWRYRQSRPGIGGANEVWAMDFVSDHVFEGRPFRILTVVELDAEAAAMVARALQDDEAAKVVDLGRRFCRIVRGCCGDVQADPGVITAFEEWLGNARACGVRVVESFAASLSQDGAAVRAGLRLPWSSGQAEGQVNRLKLLKRAMYGQAKLDLRRPASSSQRDPPNPTKNHPVGADQRPVWFDRVHLSERSSVQPRSQLYVRRRMAIHQR